MGKSVRTDLEILEMHEQQQSCRSFGVGNYKMKYGIISGFVCCDSDPDLPPVANAIVKAVNLKTGKDYFACTNKMGFYALCVPPGKYAVFPLLCEEECIKPVPCKHKHCDNKKNHHKKHDDQCSEKTGQF